MEYDEVLKLSKANKNKRVDKLLQVIILRYQGLTDPAIGEKVGYTSKHVSKLCAKFKKVGAKAYSQRNYKGNHKSLTDEQEAEILAEFRAAAEKGQVVCVGDIKKAFDAKIGRETGRGYIYEALKRLNWRTVMPRAKHPKKASDEDIEASKKLKQDTRN